MALRIGIIILILQVWKWMWNSLSLQVAEVGWKSTVSSFKAQTPQPYSVLKYLSKEVANRIDTDLWLKGHFLNNGFSSQGKPIYSRRFLWKSEEFRWLDSQVVLSIAVLGPSHSHRCLVVQSYFQVKWQLNQSYQFMPKKHCLKLKLKFYVSSSSNFCSFTC